MNLAFANLFQNGAQGRDRTTDTAIFSRMLYQLSYLGTSSHGGLGAAVYSQAGRPCPPRFALRARRGAATRSADDGRVPGVARRAKTERRATAQGGANSPKTH